MEIFITKDSNLGELAAQYPQAARVLTEYGLHCIGCFASAFDTVEAGAKLHGMDDGEIEEMIGRANDACLADDPSRTGEDDASESRREIERHPEETLSENSMTNALVQMPNQNQSRIPPSSQA